MSMPNPENQPVPPQAKMLMGFVILSEMLLIGLIGFFVITAGYSMQASDSVYLSKLAEGVSWQDYLAITTIIRCLSLLVRL